MLSVFFLFNFISHSPYGFYEFRPFGRLVEFFTQTADVRHDRVAAVFEVFFTPYLLEEFLGGNRFSLVIAEIPQD